MLRALNFLASAIPVILSAAVLSSWVNMIAVRLWPRRPDYFPIPLLLASPVVVLVLSPFLHPVFVLTDANILIDQRMVLVLFHCVLLTCAYVQMILRLGLLATPISAVVVVLVFYLYGWRVGMASLAVAIFYPLLTIPTLRRMRLARDASS